MARRGLTLRAADLVRSRASLLSIRRLTQEDVPFAMRMVEVAGWNQLPADWLRLIRVGPDGCFLAEWEGKPAGTATAVRYGTDGAWIGMVLVDPELRRKGIGRGLIAHCLAHLKGLGVRTIKLDATDQGRPVYLKQGFVDEYGALRYVGELKPTRATGPVTEIGCLAECHWPAVAALDRQAFGADRSGLLAMLVEQQPDLALVVSQGEKVAGYGLARPGRVYGYIGPVVSERMGVAQSLVAELASRLGQRTVLVDTTDRNEPWCRWLEASGLEVQRRLTRMFLGTNDTPGDPRLVHTLSAFETG
jgi:ribosomal protein S18 acetylase RimI-like enzyme